MPVLIQIENLAANLLNAAEMGAMDRIAQIDHSTAEEKSAQKNWGPDLTDAGLTKKKHED